MTRLGTWTSVETSVLVETVHVLTYPIPILLHQVIAMEHHPERVVGFSEDFDETGWSALLKQMLLGWTNFRVSLQISADVGLSSPR